uniref:Complement decay-accelerating factor-like n=1 Tax=Pogona vitticeps TaxID=103695 RepID=A0ABM5G6R9_9SAUR
MKCSEGYRRAMLGAFVSSCPLRLFVLSSLLAGIHGDCGPPPKLNNAIPLVEIHKENFSSLESVTYKCLDGFFNIRGKLDVATCLSESQWTPIEEFCEPSCVKPPRSSFAKTNPKDIRSYYLAKTNVSYLCRPGYDSIPGISSVVTCHENYTWSTLPVFCKGKSCGDPGKPENGDTVILTDLLYMAKVNFTCKKGFRLIGSPSTQCVLKGEGVEWETKPPECQPFTTLTTLVTVTMGQTELGGDSTGAIITTLTSPGEKQGKAEEEEETGEKPNKAEEEEERGEKQNKGLQNWIIIGICTILVVGLLSAAVAAALVQKRKQSYNLKQDIPYFMKVRKN